jgi:hypothetical protein
MELILLFYIIFLFIVLLAGLRNIEVAFYLTLLISFIFYFFPGIILIMKKYEFAIYSINQKIFDELYQHLTK